MIKSYEELSISKYRELIGIEKVDGEDTEYGIQILSVLSDMEPDELLEMPLEDFSKLMANTKFLYKEIERKGYKELKNKIEISGETYQVVKNARDLCAGQYIDYKAYVSRENFLEMLPYILTVFLIPEGHKYNNGYDIVELANKFDKEVDILTALSISDFFLHQSKMSMMSSITYLKWKMKKMMKKEQKTEIKEQIAACLEQLESLRSLLKISDGFIQP